MDQVGTQMHLSGPMSGLCWILFSLFLKDIPFRYCLHAVDSFSRPATSSSVLHLSSFLKFFVLYTTLIFAKFSTNSFLGINVHEKDKFYVCQTVSFCILFFFKDATKETGTNNVSFMLSVLCRRNPGSSLELGGFF